MHPYAFVKPMTCKPPHRWERRVRRDCPGVFAKPIRGRHVRSEDGVKLHTECLNAGRREAALRLVDCGLRGKPLAL
mgnify:CR=1 FL=1